MEEYKDIRTRDINGNVHGYLHRYFYCNKFKMTITLERATFIHGNVKGYYEWHNQFGQTKYRIR